MKRIKIMPLLWVCIAVMLFFVYFTPVSADEKEMIPGLISSLTVLEPIVFEKLVVFPVKSEVVPGSIPFITLEEALEQGSLVIKEVEGGRVPQVRLTNTSTHTIFIMGGEVLTGCKQDRIVGRDILIGPYKDLLVPVYCVEHGRWSYESGSFYSKKNAGTYNLRSIAQSENGAAQDLIWDEVAKMNEKMGVDTDTGAYQDAYEEGDIREKIKECEELLLTLPDTEPGITGAIVGIGTKIISIDVFADPLLFKKLWPKILKASVLSGICSTDEDVVTKADIMIFLEKMISREYTPRKAVGSGNEMCSFDDELSVSALVNEGIIIHIAAFPPVEYDEGISIWDLEIDQVDMSSSYYMNMISPQLPEDQTFLQQLGIVNEEDDKVE